MKKLIASATILSISSGCTTTTQTMPGVVQAQAVATQREAEAFRVIQAAQQAIAQANAPKGLPFIMTIGAPGETNQFSVSFTGNVMRIENATNLTGMVSVGSNLWMKAKP